ncbi:MAG TPA: DNA polymerase III subunit gamma and tau [Sporichthyaceae bacterium]
MTLALYRRYRPETFAEVIGQEHVTEPLQQAIRNGRVNHAYLFSGPRGCGKTTSARILARALNCEQGPTPTPCGVCNSCRELARGGGGGVDVVEIDAASHGGVDDARDLRDRAFFSPASSRYKIYVIDEAHMVTTAGFNALLKVVEEPPEHLKFIFATTEPEKVIPTIRSRTHHYPFRLVPPGILRDYLAELCEREKVPVDPAVLSLVVRAGGGSVRDSLSVLDQLMAGSGSDGLTLPRATALLGYTDAALLDDVIDAFAAHDGAAVFTQVDRVVEAGHDPRRFVADLLDRLRDLVVLAAVPDVSETGLIDAPVDQLDRMRAQAARFSPAELSRAADLVNTGLTELRGATAPRLQLELICARVLLPGAGPISDHVEARDLHARLDRLERRLAGTAPLPVAPPTPAPAPPPTPATSDSHGALTPPRSDATKGSAPTAPAVAVAAVAAGAPDIHTVRRMWPDVLNIVKTRRRFTWMILIDGVQVASVDDNTLVLAFAEEGKRKNFLSSGSDELLSGAIQEVLRVRWRLDAVLDPNRATASTPPPAGPAHSVPAPAAPAPPAPAAATPPPAPRPKTPTVDPALDDSAHADDEPIDEAGLTGRDLLIRELGASVLEEIDHDV